MRIILDTNILISAFIYGGTPKIVLETCIRRNDTHIFHSKHLVYECLHTIRKAQLQHAVKKANITDEDFKIYFHHISNHVAINNQQQTIRDPNDAHLLTLAEHVSADYLITGDNDLLVLKEHHDTNIITAKEFLNLRS